MSCHNPIMSLLGACECSDCTGPPSVEEPTQVERSYLSGAGDYWEGFPSKESERWYLFTIRSASGKDIYNHRREMVDMGWTVGEVRVGDEEKRDGPYVGWWLFPARKLKSYVSPAEMRSLIEWDKQHEEQDE